MTLLPDPVFLPHVETWVFDLDNTLYPADGQIMGQIDLRMTEFVMQLLDLDREAARAVQKTYWRDYGATLTGLIDNHDVDMRAFMDFVHDVDHDVLTPDPVLASRIGALEGRRLVFTNGSLGHAEKVITRLGLDGLFHELYDLEAGGYTPKPERESFERFTKAHAIAPRSAVMFEDSARNLETAAAMGMTTVLIHPGEHAQHGETTSAGEHPAHVHYAADCLPTFLGRVRQTSD